MLLRESLNLMKIMRAMVQDTLALVFLGVAFVLLACLVSYDPWDPCANVAADQVVQNWMGPGGAWIADALFQWVGIGAFALAGGCVAAFWCFSERISLRGLAWKTALATLCGSCMQTLLPWSLPYPNALWVLVRTQVPMLVQVTVAAVTILTLAGWMMWRSRRQIRTVGQRVSQTLGELKKPNKRTVTLIKPTPLAPEHQSLQREIALPSLALLKDPVQGRNERRQELHIARLQEVLEDFGVKGTVLRGNPGPIVTLYELEPAAGVKSSRVISLADDIARSMSALSARVAVISGKNVIGIELSNVHREMVYLKELLVSADYNQSAGALSLVLGKDISGRPVIVDLTKMPHLLVAGTTGSGKSVGINSMILSLLYRLRPEQCRMIMIDPKMLELSVYDGIPHLLTPVITEPKKAIMALKWVVQEMENRYRLMSQLGVRHIAGYNQRIQEAQKVKKPLMREVQVGFDQDSKPMMENQELATDPLPFIVVVVDEMADLMLVAGKDLEILVQRLAQMARAAGIHLIMATQRPSVDVITGTIKANFPTRISFQVTSKIDSRTILGEQGAEHLLGQGDMLYMAAGGRITRVHGPFVSDEEIEHVVTFLRDLGTPDYIDLLVRDDGNGADDSDDAGGTGGHDVYRQAVDIVLRDRKTSISYLQRRLQIGYNRAARLIEQMEKEGIISPPNPLGRRDILD